jgi:hypothetical protein
MVRMIGEQITGKDMEGSGHGLTEVTIPVFACRE